MRWSGAAEQIELVDLTPEALRRRMAHGNIYTPEKVDAALGNYFRTGNLTALRELALLWVADRVDESLQDYRERHGIAAPWETRERVVVALTGAPGNDNLIRRAARIAARAKGELIGIHVRADDGLTSGSRQRSTTSASCSRSWAAPTARLSAPTSPRRSWARPAPRAPPSSCSAPAAVRGGTRSPAGRSSAGSSASRAGRSMCT